MRYALLLLLLGLTGPVLSQPLVLVPAPDEKVVEDRPFISVSWPEGAVVANRCRLWLNDQEVTGQCLRNGHYLTFRPYKAPPSGSVAVRFAGEDSKGQPLEKSWTFELAPAPWIQNLSHDGQSDLLEDDLLQVKFRAPARGRASFTIGSLSPVQMVESEPGSYQGSYRVKASDCSLASPVTVHYQKGDHKEDASIAPNVKVFGGLYRVRITSPPDGSLVEQSFVLTGHARPGSRVSIIPKIGFTDRLAPPTTNSNTVSGTAGSIPAEVDEQGNFQVEYGVPLVLPGMRVVMSIFTIDPEGNRSMPTIVHYRFK